MIKPLTLAFCLTGIAVTGFAQTTTFPLQEVRLLDGPFKEAQQTDQQYILALDADRLLFPFLREAGLPMKAPSYGNWENTGLDGHVGGHYLTALSLMYASTGEKALKDRLDYMVGQLAQCQQANGDGYVGGVPGGKAMWKEIAAGKIDAGSFSLNGKWVPLYNIHKLYAGLYDAWTIGGNQQAKEVLVKLTDWCVRLVSNLTDEQVQQMLRSEHGGLNEVFANIGASTGNKEYLTLARRFSDRRILDPLLQNKDALTGIHANTQIPKVIGYQRIANIEKDTAWHRAADFFWHTVVEHRTVSIGGNSVREHFHPANDFSSMIESREGPETCNSYNMLKLSKELFLGKPAGQYMDYYERTLYNHILSSQRPGGGFVYFTPMRPNHYRVYSQPQDGFWCCVGSGLENHGKYGEMIYAHDKTDLYVNLFIPSVLNWKEKGITVTQETAFPAESANTIKLQLTKPQTFQLRLRRPAWVAANMVIRVNKKVVKPVYDAASGYYTIKRLWKTGDQVGLELPMVVTSEFLPDQSSWISFVYGPLVLAAATDTVRLDGLLADGSRMGHIAAGPLEPLEKAPLVVEAANTGQPAANWSSQLVNKGQLRFEATRLFDQPAYQHLRLQPFYTIHNSRYVIYFPYTTKDSLPQVRERLKSIETAGLALEAQTVDVVHCGEQQPENDHGFTGAQTENGLFRERSFRNAKGWFSYQLRNREGKAKTLRITTWGKERNRRYEVYMNDQLVTTVSADGSGPEQFITTDLPLPASVLADKPAVITVKFVGKDNMSTANIFEVRLLQL
ncbi:glycoside hydrolase family 127 protein [Paraflavitalea pollutisoli]|uniref:glycoside hydrolase family 127 protein n=1 Tax=Paraflavitalea pollutisoli TaxID=3034143 RepID=UPI0023EB366F|nr:glycoside hydrolase family 127 protein [Paraflavitalea sp. H1-2-19X]